MDIAAVQKNLSENMLWYTLGAIVLGLGLGAVFDLRGLSAATLPIVFVLIYPMMVNISLSSLKKIRGSRKPLIEALIINFVYAPVFMWFLTSLFIHDSRVALALMMLAIAPASSMGLGYIGLAEGHVLTGALIVAVAFILSVFVYPLLGQYFASGANIHVPTAVILKNLTLVLVVPLILGVLTREYVERAHGREKYLKIKLYLSTITLAALYLLIFVIFASKARMILHNWVYVLYLLPIALIYYFTTLLLILVVNSKLLDFEYGHHQAVVFTSVSKNIALTIAILVAVFGKDGQYMAVFPAIMSLFQAPILMFYLKRSESVRRWFGKD